MEKKQYILQQKEKERKSIKKEKIMKKYDFTKLNSIYINNFKKIGR